MDDAASGPSDRGNARGSISLALVFLLFVGCTGMPEKVRPVDHFDAAKYLGRWYEIARLDHSFERGLTHVTAEYSRRSDGGIRVLNRGYAPEDGTWKQAEGKAYFVEGPDVGYLKVSFFGPFYGSYVVFALDRDDYRYAVVSGPDESYLWILARSPVLKEEIKTRLVKKAEEAGFDVGKLIFVEHGTME